MLPVTEGPLAGYRAKPLVDEVAAAERLRPGYRDHAMDLAHTAQHDPLIDLNAAGVAGENYYHSQHNPPYHGRIKGAVPYLYLRAPLVRALKDVNARLAPYGLELWVFDAWRPIAVQNHFHDHWMPNHLRNMHPELAGDTLQSEVEKYWARGAPGGVVDPLSPPPHNTGAAVDLTIRRTKGAELFMGSIFDDVTDVSNTAHFETVSGMAFSATEARDNRRMLYWLMSEAGFANNPTEWWHYSCGDQMWARLTGATAAHYSAIIP